MKQDLIEMVGSRICHDLISPIGAIGNGVELLSLTQSTATEEMSLIENSVQNASARVRFFRIAFGAAQEGQLSSSAEISRILGDLATAGRFQYEWKCTQSIPRTEVRAVFLLLQCIEASLPLGGEISIDNRGVQWEVIARAPSIQQDRTLWQSLSSLDPLEAVTPATVNFALLASALTEMRRTLSYAAGTNQLSATF